MKSTGITKGILRILAFGLIALLAVVETGSACDSARDCKDTPLDKEALAAAEGAASESKASQEPGKRIMLAEDCPTPKCKSLGLDDLFRTGLAFAPKTSAPQGADKAAPDGKGKQGQTGSDPAKLMLAENCQNPNCKSVPIGGDLRKEIGIAMELPFEKSGSAYGFSSGQAASSASKAFAAGLWEARGMLLGNDSSEPIPAALASTEAGSYSSDLGSTSYADYRRLGQWVMLLNILSRFDVQTPDGFWGHQMQGIENARSAFKDRPEAEAGVVQATLDELLPPIRQLAAEPDNRRAAKTLNQEVDQLISRLAPSVM